LLPFVAKLREREEQRVSQKRRPWPLAINHPIASSPCKVQGKGREMSQQKRRPQPIAIDHLIAFSPHKGKGKDKKRDKLAKKGDHGQLQSIVWWLLPSLQS